MITHGVLRSQWFDSLVTIYNKIADINRENDGAKEAPVTCHEMRWFGVSNGALQAKT